MSGLPESLSCVLGRSTHAVTGAQIAANPSCLTAVRLQFADRGGQLRLLACHDHDARPGPREGPGDGSTYAGTTAGHYGDPVAQRKQFGEYACDVMQAL